MLGVELHMVLKSSHAAFLTALTLIVHVAVITL
jgi:hypothetical protein